MIFLGAGASNELGIPTLQELSEDVLNGLIGFDKPDLMNYNSPITAEWVVWCYKALNYMTTFIPYTAGDREDKVADNSPQSAYLSDWAAASWVTAGDDSQYFAYSLIYAAGRHRGIRYRPLDLVSTYNLEAPTITLWMLWRQTTTNEIYDWLGWDDAGFAVVKDEYCEMDSSTSESGNYTWPVISAAPTDAPIGPADGGTNDVWRAYVDESYNLALIDYSTSFDYK